METWLDIYDDNGTIMVQFNNLKSKLYGTTVAVGTKEQAIKGKKLIPCADGSTYKVPMYVVALIKESSVGKYFPVKDDRKKLYSLPWDETDEYNERSEFNQSFRGACLTSVTYTDGRYFETISVKTKWGHYFGRKLKINIPQFVKENMHWVGGCTYFSFFSKNAAFTLREGLSLSEEQFQNIIKEMFKEDYNNKGLYDE